MAALAPDAAMPTTAATIFDSVFDRGAGRAARYGEFTLVVLQSGTFVTTPMEYAQVQGWARSRVSSGVGARDRALFVDRFATLLARVGGGLATRGDRQVLSRIVRAMKEQSMALEEWAVPHDLDDGKATAAPEPHAAEPAFEGPDLEALLLGPLPPAAGGPSDAARP